MPPKGPKKSAASKRGANLRKQVATKQQKKSVNKEPAPTHDANGLLIGSKEANWALLKASGKWYTDLDEQDFGEAEEKGVQLGSEEWIKMKTPQLAPPVLEDTRLLSRVEWDFPTPQLSAPPPPAPRRNKRKATMDNDDVDVDAPPARKRSRRGAVAASEEGDTPEDILALLALPPSRSGPKMAFGMGTPVLDTLPPRQRKKATVRAAATTVETSSASVVEVEEPAPAPPSPSPPSPPAAPPAVVDAPPAAAVEAPPAAVGASPVPEPIAPASPAAPLPAPAPTPTSTPSSALSSLASQTPSPPPSSLKQETSPSPAVATATPRKLSTAATVGTPGRKGARGTFPCDKCERSFGRVEHLVRHGVSVHDRVKGFVCEGCRGRFSRKDNMRQHQGKCGGFLALGGGK